ncbi:MAG: 5-methyltetrahydropteroyltriglutamate--homocysteine S-methyltransferase [Sutterella sp.]|nr:5-methyltetrahydropteroyltriglutamate--homocysteine S-methyltransferase [Sutterella sp.]
MSRVNPPFRADVVGSFLRPQALHEARRAFAQGTLSREQLTAIEDREIADLIEKEKANGLRAVTDGEFRRAFWHLDFLAALGGIEHIKAEAWSVKFEGVQPKAETVKIVDEVTFPDNHPFLEAFDRVKSLAGDTLVKFTIPSPSMLHLICCVREANYQPIDRYRDHEDQLFRDLANTWKAAVKALYARGCRYLQFDDTSWGEFCSAEKRASYAARGIDVDVLAQHYVDVLNDILAAKPEDLTITMHICRGNFRSTWFSSGGYEPVAKTLFGQCNVDGFFLEYDSERAGTFEPLRFIKNQTVVLGLVTSKFPALEAKEAIKARIQEATQYVPLAQLALSPQCGFSSTEEGNLLTEANQWAKVRLCVEVAKEVWEDA